MTAALRILFDVASYRLRRLEMANLAAAVAVMLALHTPWLDLVLRTAFGAGLNLLAYLTNDYCDVEQDFAEGRELSKTRFLREHLGAALGAQLGLGALLAAAALLYEPGLLLPLGLGAGVCWAYSAKLKALPAVDILSMVVWGISMPLIAFPLGNKLGWLLALQLGLFSACFESIQVLRDHDQDARAGVRTSAVVFGPEATRRLVRICMLLAMLYGVLVVDRYAGLALAVALLVPQPGAAEDTGAVSRYWNRIRLVQGLSWLALLTGVFLRGTNHGWLSSGVGG